MAKTFTNVRDIIDDYKDNYLSNIKDGLAACKTANDFVYGKPLDAHQRRWSGRFEEIVNAISLTLISGSISFEELYDFVRKIYSSNGHPNAYLAMYDTALRIGYNLSPQILPEKFVYLYGTSKTGPMGGATNLFGSAWVKKHLVKSYPHCIETRYFMAKFPNLPSWEIESILCIYADDFKYHMPL